VKNLYALNAEAIQAWAADVTTNAVNRTTLAMEEISNGNYGTEHLLRDIYRYVEDLMDYPYGAVSGALPIAYITIDNAHWQGDVDSNTIPLPIPRNNLGAPDISSFEISQIEDTAAGKALFDPSYATLQLDGGTKSVSVKILLGNIPQSDRPPRGFYHTSIVRLINQVPKPAAELHVNVR
jgi:hypothetical protein